MGSGGHIITYMPSGFPRILSPPRFPGIHVIEGIHSPPVVTQTERKHTPTGTLHPDGKTGTCGRNKKYEGIFHALSRVSNIYASWISFLNNRKNGETHPCLICIAPSCHSHHQRSCFSFQRSTPRYNSSTFQNEMVMPAGTLVIHQGKETAESIQQGEPRAARRCPPVDALPSRRVVNRTKRERKEKRESFLQYLVERSI